MDQSLHRGTCGVLSLTCGKPLEVTENTEHPKCGLNPESETRALTFGDVGAYGETVFGR